MTELRHNVPALMTRVTFGCHRKGLLPWFIDHRHSRDWSK